MKRNYILATASALLLALSGCSGFLDQEPDKILTDKQVFSDPALIKSVVANLYERVTYGQHVQGELYDYARGDDAIRYEKDEVKEFDRNRWREYNYGLVRDINQFLEGLKGSTVLTEADRKAFEGEARLIRAWYYFCSCRALGGMPIVGDEIFTYTPGMDITPLQKPRATEAAMYDYIIKECNEIAVMLPVAAPKRAARASKWTAKMLEARAALYAASLAKYNNASDRTSVKTANSEVGIDASKASSYYAQALAAAKEVINHSPYVLQDNRGNKPEEKARNFYEAVCIKDNNTEVIWARDYIYPSATHGFTKNNLPATMAQDADCSYLSILLNLVEEYEPINTATPGQGAKFVTGTLDNPVFYSSAAAPFLERDPRLGGTVLYPGSVFAGNEVVLQAGQLNLKEGKWTPYWVTDLTKNKDAEGNLITSANGPTNSLLRLINSTGFCIRKFMDETPSAGTIERGSDMWSPRFRIAEAYLIAAEASLELSGGTGDAVTYINKVRTRAGVQPLTVVTFSNIVHERRVELAFEDHRYWDMKRWRLADKQWTGNANDESATRRGLWPYLVIASGSEHNKKWIFVEKNMNFQYPNPLKFEAKAYYSELDNQWLNDNPKLTKNPEQ